MKINKELFGKTAAGKEVWLYTLSNSAGIVVKITNLGCIITALELPDREGHNADVVLGFNDLESYLGDHPYFGVVAGRYANRIANGRFSLDGVEHQLTLNEGNHHLHGGEAYFGSVLWESQEIKGNDWVGLRLSYLAKDGEEGYPGNLRTTVTYLLNEQNELEIKYEAVTDQTTVVNLTNHSYFNLSGEASGDILQHEVMINAKAYTAVDQELIPTGEILPVQGTALDFTESRLIGDRIAELEIGGYDHNYVLDKADGELAFAAKLQDASSGRAVEVFTTKPGLQFYTGNSLTGEFQGKGGKFYSQYSGLCLETQFFPDAPNHHSFPSARLEPGETYEHKTVYKFSVID